MLPSLHRTYLPQFASNLWEHGGIMQKFSYTRSANELKRTQGSPDQLHSSFKDLHWTSRGAMLPQFLALSLPREIGVRLVFSLLRLFISLFVLCVFLMLATYFSVCMLPVLPSNFFNCIYLLYSSRAFIFSLCTDFSFISL